MKRRRGTNIALWPFLFCLGAIACWNMSTPTLAPTNILSPLPTATFTSVPTVISTITPESTEIATCDHWRGSLELVAVPSRLRVGENVTLKLLLSNTTCGRIGQIRYIVSVKTEGGQSIFDPPQSMYLVGGTHGTLEPGGSATEILVLQAKNPGQAALNATVNFESHEGYPGPAYWGYAESPPILVDVTR